MDVRKDRDKYIGGSDEPAIMGISPFKTRWELLQEKLSPESVEPFTNEYIEYGVRMESVIRGHIEEQYNCKFPADEVFKGHVRYHSDGFDGSRVLEIKTTSKTSEDISGYKQYLVQLLIGMWCHDVENGILAVYERGDEEFDPLRLQVFDINRYDYEPLLIDVLSANDTFWQDLEWLRENPFAIESELPSSLAITPTINRIVEMENAIRNFKIIENELKAMKMKLYDVMTEHSIKYYETPDGIRFTRVLPVEDKEEEVFDDVRFRTDHPDMWTAYQKSVTKRGKAGYVRISGLTKKSS